MERVSIHLKYLITRGINHINSDDLRRYGWLRKWFGNVWDSDIQGVLLAISVT
jgi:hypothetical protein